MDELKWTTHEDDPDPEEGEEKMPDGHRQWYYTIGFDYGVCQRDDGVWEMYGNGVAWEDMDPQPKDADEAKILCIVLTRMSK